MFMPVIPSFPSALRSHPRLVFAILAVCAPERPARHHDGNPMNIAYYLVLFLHIASCLFLIGVVLLQQGKSQDLASAFGGGGHADRFRPARVRERPLPRDDHPGRHVHGDEPRAVDAAATRELDPGPRERAGGHAVRLRAGGGIARRAQGSGGGAGRDYGARCARFSRHEVAVRPGRIGGGMAAACSFRNGCRVEDGRGGRRIGE